jgi:hypothetical protein
MLIIRQPSGGHTAIARRKRVESKKAHKARTVTCPAWPADRLHPHFTTPPPQ